jgi:hypothetical protein
MTNSLPLSSTTMNFASSYHCDTGCSDASSHGTRAHSTRMALLTNQNYFGYLEGARFMPELFSSYFSTDANKHLPHIQANEDSPIFVRAIVNSQPSFTCVHAFF